MLSRSALVFFLLILLALPLAAFEPSSTSPYTFNGTFFCPNCETFSHERAGDGFHHDSGCDQSGSPFYFCDCPIGYNPGKMLQAPILRVIDDHTVELEYFARNAYCNPPADGGNINEPNAIPFFINVIEIDPFTLTTNPTPKHVVPPYWEHGKIRMTDMDPGCKMYRAIYVVMDIFSNIYAVSSDVAGGNGSSTCAVIPDMGSCPIGNGPKGGVSPAVGKPINVGSGNMHYAQTLFRVQEPGASPLDFTISYNSAETNAGPLGPGFTHSFAQSMQATPGSGAVRIWRRPDGTRVLFARENHPPTGEIWRPIYPGDATGTIVNDGTAGRYKWTDLKGTVTEVDNASSGVWRKTADRWGNAFTASYTGSNLTTLTDPLGRTWTLAYSGSLLTSITDGDSNQWRFAYDGSNRLEKIFDPLHTSTTPWRQFTWTTYATGKSAVALVTDDSGAVLEGHEYDSSGRATSSWSGDTITGSAPSPGTNARDLVTLSYDSLTQTTVTSKIDTSINESTVYTLEVGHGRVLASSIVGTCVSCGATEEAQAFTFDDENHALTRTVGLDKTSSGGTDERVTSTYTYDTNGMVLTATAATGTADEHTTTFAYGVSSWPEFVTSITEDSVAKSGQSRTVTYAWSAGETQLDMARSGYLLSTDSTPTTYTTTTLFDSRHRVTEIDGPRTNQKTTRSYYSDSDSTLNRRGRLQTITDYVTTSATLSRSFDDYDIYGTARTATDANGVDTTLTLDARGRVLTETSVHPPSDSNEPADYVTTYAYDSRDRLTSLTSPRGLITRRVYEDGTNRVLQTIRADSSGDEHERMLLTLNTIGRTTSEAAQDCGTPASPCSSWTTRHSESYTYDATARLTTTTHPDTSFTVNSYDSRGNLTGIRDERHSAANTLFAYDARNRLKTTTQKRTIVSGSDVVTQTTHDGQNNVASVTDPNGNVTTYAFDDFARMQSQASPVSGTTTYAYDASDNVTSVTDANGASTARTYDLLNRSLTSTSTRTGRPTETVTWTWDNATAGDYGLGRLTSVTDPSGTTDYEYERRGLSRIEGTTLAAGSYGFTYAYDEDGNRTSITYPSGNIAEYTFDFANRPSAATWNSSPLVNSATYAPFGPIESIDLRGGTTQTMTYDSRYRMSTNVFAKTGVGTLASYSYGYDDTSNITSLTDVQSSAYNRTFAYDDLNRVITANGGASLWGSGSYSYDAMGNMTGATLGSATTSFSYSGTTPKLSSVTTGAGTTSVSYDSAGNETASAVISARNHVSQVTTTNFGITYDYDFRGIRAETSALQNTGDLYVRDHLYSPELRVLARYDYFTPLLATFPQPPDFTEYFWLGDRPVAQFDTNGATSSTTTHYTFADHLATPILQSATVGTVTWRVEYDPYGSIYTARAGAAGDQALRFPGQETENFGDRTNNVFRWYRSEWGRYSQADPVGLNGGVNLFAYVGDKPTAEIDPLGLFTLPSPNDRNYQKCRTLRKGYAQKELDRVRQVPRCQQFFRGTCNSDLNKLFSDPLPRIELKTESERQSGGAFDANNPDVIVISMRECKAMEDFAHTFIHELGHYADYHNNNDAISDADHSDGCMAEIECFGFTDSINCQQKGFKPYRQTKR